MARSTLEDYLQVYPFWLFDVAPIDPLALPIFSPLAGFNTISSPELKLETHIINEGNWYFPTEVVKGASVAPITLARGSRWFDSDFYRWVITAMTGDTGGASIADPTTTGPGVGRPLDQAMAIGGVTPRRNLLLVHFLSRSPFDAAANAGIVAGALAGFAAGTGGAATAFNALGILSGDFAPRIPAKAWMLYGCLPMRYKTGSDFDASSSDVSIMELDVTVEYFDEISLSSV